MKRLPIPADSRSFLERIALLLVARTRLILERPARDEAGRGKGRGRRRGDPRAAVNSAKRELAYRIDAHETACPECYNREPLNPNSLDSHTTTRRQTRFHRWNYSCYSPAPLRAASSLIRFHETLRAGGIIIPLRFKDSVRSIARHR